MLASEKQRFLSEIEIDNHCLGFSLFGTTFFFSWNRIHPRPLPTPPPPPPPPPIHSGSKTLTKVFSCSILAWNYVKRLMFRIRITDHWRHLLHWRNFILCMRRQADYQLLRRFLCVDFLRCIVLKLICSHFLDAKLRFYPNLCPFTQRWTRPNWRKMARKKKFISRRKCRRVSRNFVIVNKSIKKGRKFDF